MFSFLGKLCVWFPAATAPVDVDLLRRAGEEEGDRPRGMSQSAGTQESATAPWGLGMGM